MSEIIIVKDDGTSLVGSDGDHLYDGVREKIGYDELVVTTDIAQDGLSFVRTATLPSGEVRSATRLDLDGFTAGVMPKVLAGLPEDASQQDIDAAVQAAWDAECAITSFGKVYVDALVDGDLQTVEKKITHIVWTER